MGRRDGRRGEWRAGRRKNGSGREREGQMTPSVDPRYAPDKRDEGEKWGWKGRGRGA